MDQDDQVTTGTDPEVGQTTSDGTTDTTGDPGTSQTTDGGVTDTMENTGSGQTTDGESTDSGTDDGSETEIGTDSDSGSGSETEQTEESILNSIKKLLGPEEDYTHFDKDIILHINAAFSRLCQLGVGPSTPFKIRSAEEVWTDFIEDGMLEDVKQYVYLKVKVIFDPPGNSSLLNAMNVQINQLEWLMNSVAEVGY